MKTSNFEFMLFFVDCLFTDVQIQTQLAGQLFFLKTGKIFANERITGAIIGMIFRNL